MGIDSDNFLFQFFTRIKTGSWLQTVSIIVRKCTETTAGRPLKFLDVVAWAPDSVKVFG